MYWSLLNKVGDSESAPVEDSKVADASPSASTDGDKETMSAGRLSNLFVNDSLSDTGLSPVIETEEPSPHDENEEPSTGVDNDNPPDKE